ncbi:VOC family protein [bacterium]|nr:VOC family protein [bacterium]NCQ54778.1 VOC family protein [Candidatus Parcubacteria bacterium]NCS68031.1 VOC family protein [Candidatus Peregrinibacteria bacterium]NCS95768.1 VOC family protein [bacterium]
MKSKISLITLGVDDLNASRQFYEKLGFKLAVEENLDSVVFFELSTSGMLFGLFPKEKLAEDSQVPNDGAGFPGFSLAHNVSSPEEVDKVLEEAVAAGATLAKAGEKVFWGGYSGYFKDPSGFLWEVAHNPFMDLT